MDTTGTMKFESSEALAELYQELILDHSKNPRCHGELSDPTSSARGHNPLCGDQILLYLKTDGETITDISFTASGCAISVASASLMSDRLKGSSIAEAQAVFAQFHNLVTEGRHSEEVDESIVLGELEALAGVRQFPIRIKCATLAWHALSDALAQSAAKSDQNNSDEHNGDHPTSGNHPW